MKLEQAKRESAKFKCALQGPSGSGKTMSALLLANGLESDWSKIAVIDTENNSSHLYAHLGNFKVVNLQAPFTPERYIEAIELCVESGIEVIVVDSISHEWEGTGGILETHGNMMGNSFTNWNKVTPRHNAFVQKILQSPVHIVATIRSKQDYVLTERNGKMVPEKVGMKSITRDGMDYEFTLVLELDLKHHASASKDRTGMFMDKPTFVVTQATGTRIIQWCRVDQGREEVILLINNAQSVEELKEVYYDHPVYQQELDYLFRKRNEYLLKTAV